MSHVLLISKYNFVIFKLTWITFTRVLLLSNKIHRSLRAKQWLFSSLAAFGGSGRKCHCFALKLRWILFKSNRTRVNVIQVSLNMTNYTLRFTKHGTILLSHVLDSRNMGQFYCPMFRESSWTDNGTCPMFHVIWKLAWILVWSSLKGISKRFQLSTYIYSFSAVSS